MTNEQINIAIAEACGWGNDDIERGYALCQFSESVPNYCNDLNAMHEAEKVLSDKQCQTMNDLLWDMMNGRKFLWQATARQRAEAFLKTIGKWEGGPQ